MSLRRLLDRLRSGYGFLPTVLVGLAVVAAVVLPLVDAESFPSITGDPATARSVVATGATATVTFGGLVFSITVVALQLTSSQFSPRVLRQFLRDRAGQMALGTFVGVFIYDLLVLARIDSGQDPFVPGLAVDVSVAASAVAVFTFVAFVGHIAQAIRVVNIIESVAAETRAVAERLPRADADATGSDVLASRAVVRVLARPGPGAVFQDLGDPTLAEIGRDHDVVLVVTPQIGDFVPGGHPVVEVWGTPVGECPIEWHHVRHAFGFGPERTMTRDMAFGFRQLADIAERALSPALNDPTTAVQCIDRLHDLLRDELGRPPLRSVRRDADGVVRVVHDAVSRDELVRLAFDEIRIYSGNAIQVSRRVRAALEDLRSVAPPPCHPVLDEQLELLEATVRHSYPLAQDREQAAVADAQGLGDSGDE